MPVDVSTGFIVCWKSVKQTKKLKFTKIYLLNIFCEHGNSSQIKFRWKGRKVIYVRDIL